MSFDHGGFLFGVFDDKYIDHLFIYIIYNMYHFLSFFFTQTIFLIIETDKKEREV